MGIALRAAPLLLLAGCVFDDPDPMELQPRAEAFRQSAFFDDGRSMRVPPEHAVAFAPQVPPPEVATGLGDDGEPLARLPVPLTRGLLDRGRHHFEIICATCHGLLGDGNSRVAQKMTLRPPPSLLVHLPHTAPDGGTEVGATAPGQRHPHLYPGHVFGVVTHGYGLMSSYAAELPVPDRWAVVAYLEALRLSQRAPYAALPPALQRQVREAGR